MYSRRGAILSDVSPANRTECLLERKYPGHPGFSRQISYQLTLSSKKRKALTNNSKTINKILKKDILHSFIQ